MLASLKELILIVAAAAVVAQATGQVSWLWKQIAMVRQVALDEAKKDWGCPSIFDKLACRDRD